MMEYATWEAVLMTDDGAPTRLDAMAFALAMDMDALDDETPLYDAPTDRESAWEFEW